MDQLIASCNQGLQYPQNLPTGEYLGYLLESYFHKLNENELRLFSSGSDSELTFLDFDHDGQSLYSRTLPAWPWLTLTFHFSFLDENQGQSRAT